MLLKEQLLYGEIKIVKTTGEYHVVPRTSPRRTSTWKFLEIWVDPVLFPPKILMLVSDQDGTCRIFNPASGYRLVVSHTNYQTAQEWLLEDEYERVALLHK
jgi:hypothetical protein